MTRPPERPPIPFPKIKRPPNHTIPHGPPYAELQCVTNFSFLRGGSHPAELVQQAKILGITALGIADRNSVAGVVRAHAAAEKEGFRIVVGAHIDTVPDDFKPRVKDGRNESVEGHGPPGFSCLLYPTNRAAWGRLCKLLSKGKLCAPKGECHLWFEDLFDALEGQVVIAVPPEGLDLSRDKETPPKPHNVIQLEEVRSGQNTSQSNSFEARLNKLNQAASGALYLAANHHYTGDDRRRLHVLNDLATRIGISMVATNDVHIHHPDRRPLQDVISCIREKCTLETAGFKLVQNAERHLKHGAEMARLFERYPQAIAATQEIVERCTFSLNELSYNYPNEPVPPGKSPQQHLTDLVWEGTKFFYPDGVPDAVKVTLLKELQLIEKLDYAQYFLTVHDIVRWARDEKILCQGRGSAANSVVCYCLGVTAVDPTKVSLLFDRFLSEDRKEPPDIDVDFEHERREEVIQYIYERYGRDRAGIAATVITYRPRSAVREVGKVMGLTEDVTSALASTVWGSWGSEIPAEQIKESGLDITDPHLARTIALTQELLGFPRHLSQHVGGFVLTEDPLDEMIPVGNAAMAERTFIEWDKDDIDELRIMKVDVLALGMLTCIRKCFDLLRDHYHQDFTLANLPREDEAVYEMLQHGDSLGTFQVESRAQMSMLPRLKPACFYDLVIEVAIVRPGPIQGDMVHPYLRRRDGIEQVIYPSPAPEHGPPDELEKILGRTLGVPLFQEQAMQIAIDAAKFTGDEANQLRKAMATFRRAGTIHELEEKMVGKMIGRGYDPDFSRRCFDQIKGFGEYGFPESHAASFALLVYVSSWIKCHYPDVFCAGLLNAQPMGFYAPAQIVRDARDHGMEVRPIDVNHSFWDNTLEENFDGSFAVRLGFRQADGLRKEVMDAFVGERESESSFTSPLAGEDSETQRSEAELPVDLDEGYPINMGAQARRTPHPTSINARHPPREVCVSLSRKGRGGNVTFTSLEHLHRNSSLTIATLERLAANDAFRSLGLDRRQALWSVKGLVSDAQLPLFTSADTDTVGDDLPVTLPGMRESEHVVADYQTHRLSLKAHPLSFLRERYAASNVIPCCDLATSRNGRRVSVAGVVLVRQRPGTAKGVVFMTIEDETGIANIVVWKKVMERFRKTIMTARLVKIRGQMQRAGEVIHVVANDIADMTGDLDLLSDDTLPEVVAYADHVKSPLPGGPPRETNDRRKPEFLTIIKRDKRSAEKDVPIPLARADEVKNQQHDRREEPERPSLKKGITAPARGTHPRNVRIIPKSRDFH